MRGTGSDFEQNVLVNVDVMFEGSELFLVVMVMVVVIVVVMMVVVVVAGPVRASVGILVLVLSSRSRRTAVAVTHPAAGKARMVLPLPGDCLRGVTHVGSEMGGRVSMRRGMCRRAAMLPLAVPLRIWLVLVCVVANAVVVVGCSHCVRLVAVSLLPTALGVTSLVMRPAH